MGNYGILYIVLFMLMDTVKCNYISVLENSTIHIKCGDNNKNPVVKTQWLDANLDDATLSSRFTIGTNGSLLIKRVRRYDAGEYTCNSRIRTEHGLTPKSVVVYLNVKYVPTITTIKPSITVYQNSNVVLPCSAKGNPSVTFQWRYPNRSVIKDSSKYLLYTNGSLLIRSVQRADVFTYTCAPYNGVGEGVNGYTLLGILIPPRFISLVNQSVDIIEGASFSLDCNASGTPTPTVTWSFLNGSINKQQSNDSVVGVFHMANATGRTAGVYACIVQSKAGKIIRYFVVNVIGKPGVPRNFKVANQDRNVNITWTPAYNGGSPQHFELWYRASEETDYDWITIASNASAVALRGVDIARQRDSFHFYSLRAQNKKGYSDFTRVVRAFALSDQLKMGIVTRISDNPLEPSRFTVNMSTQGYNLTWQYMITPGRPPSNRFIVEYRVENSTSGWKEYHPRKRWKRSAHGDPRKRWKRSVHGDITEGTSIVAGEIRTTLIDIPVSDIGVSGVPLEFQVSSVTSDNIRSRPSAPTVVHKSGMPGGEKDEKFPPSTSDRSRDADLIPAIVLGAIFGLFVIILITSLYCFCRRKKRCRGKKNGRSPPHTETNGATKKSALVEYNGSGNTADAKFNTDSPRRFHVSTCPALQLGKSTNNNNGNGKTKRQTDDVFFLMEANSKEKVICTCNKKYLTLDEHDQPKKSTKKKVLYKSTSSPSILQASENEENSPVDTTGLLADEDFDVSELEDDVVTELDSSRIPQLERSAFKDSYDPFCRSESVDVSFKDVANLRPSVVEKPVIESSTSKDADVSSSGTVESEQSNGVPKLTKEPHRDSKTSDSKSSGYGEGVAPNTSSNHFENFNPITRFVPLTSTRSDIGYYSDASSRLSPLEFMNNSKYQASHRNKLSLPGHNTQYFSEDEAMLHGTLHRPLKPPSYTQAIVDIERMSEKSEKTDSEKSFDHLLEMERQLGVRLCDSDDSDLTTKSLMTSRYRHSIPRNYFSDTGYTSDIGSWKDKYTNREKTLRCNQLLEEFKSSRKSGSEQTLVEASPVISPPLVRPYSLVDNIIPEESPILKRKDSCSSTYNEWLV